jgi:D-arginine dehydrogenase
VPGSELRIAVVGGGIAGVSIAYELAAEARVVLFETETQLAHHTTGRSAAMYLQSYGNRAVRALTVASEPDFGRLQEVLATPPLLRPQPQLWIADAEARPRLEALLESGGPLRALSAKEAGALCPALRHELLVGAALDLSAREIEVMALHQGYVRGLAARRGEIRRGSPVTSLVRSGKGWTVGAPTGTLEVDVVVDAAGAWADPVAALAGAAPAGIRPLRRTLFTSPVEWPSPTDAWPFVADLGERFYFHAEHDQVLVSPSDETPDVPRDARPEEMDIARTLEVVNRFTTLGLRSVRSAWAGLRSFAADRSPVVGSRAAEPGFFWFAGQGGYGIQMAPALARAGAALLLHGHLPDDLEGCVGAAELSPERPALTRCDLLGRPRPGGFGP